MLKIIYEDNHVIAVFKPAGVQSQPDASGDESIFEQVKKHLRETKALKFQRNLVLGRALNSLSALEHKKPGNVYLGLLHRLDRPVSGVMLFAKTSKGAARLSEQFRNRTVVKTYHAIVVGKPAQKKGVLINKLGKDEKLKKAKEYKDGQEVRLQYEVVKSSEKYSLLKIQLEGGKFHQIRAQLSLAGFPILGDVKYLPAGRQVGEIKWYDERSIALCASCLSFKKVTVDETVELKIDIPGEWEKYFR